MGSYRTVDPRDRGNGCQHPIVSTRRPMWVCLHCALPVELDESGPQDAVVRPLRRRET